MSANDLFTTSRTTCNPTNTSSTITNNVTSPATPMNVLPEVEYDGHAAAVSAVKFSPFQVWFIVWGSSGRVVLSRLRVYVHLHYVLKRRGSDADELGTRVLHPVCIDAQPIVCHCMHACTPHIPRALYPTCIVPPHTHHSVRSLHLQAWTTRCVCIAPPTALHCWW